MVFAGISVLCRPASTAPQNHYNLNLGSSPSAVFRMDVTVNGATEAIAEPCSVAELLAARGHDTARVVVERNGEILPRERFAQTLLCGGDSLEIVHFVGGG